MSEGNTTDFPEGILMLGDCLERMTELPDGSVDMILADLPYGTTACKWDAIIPFEPLWKQFKRVTKKNAAIVLTASQPFTTVLINSNFAMFRYEWIWLKSNGGGFLNANRMPLKRHENVLVFYRALPTYNPQKTSGKAYTCTRASAGETTQDQSVAGWVTKNDGSRFPVSYQDIPERERESESYAYIPNETGLHPTQKPVALMEYLIKTYTNEGELVFDPTMGSGSTCVAAKNTGRLFVGIEKEQKYFDIACKRIAAGMVLR